jgi:hypothetical protein
MNKRYIEIEWAVLFMLFILFASISATIMPATDDWHYFTSPNFKPELGQLLPRTGYWRPLDVMFGWLLGLVPSFYPYLNHILVSLNHVLLIWIILRVSESLSIKRKAALIGAVCFAISPAVMATLLSVDSLNQSFSMLWGGWAIYTYLKLKGRKRVILYLLFSVLSVLSKESGIVWVLIAPFLSVLCILPQKENLAKIKRISIRTIITSLLFVIVYFSLRILITPATESFGSDNPENRLYLSIFSLSFIKNIVLLFGSGLTTLDTISLFLVPRNYTFIIISFLLGVPFLFLLIVNLFKKISDRNSVLKSIIFIILIIASASPHLVLTQTAEMHVYPTVFMIAIFIGWLMNDVKFSKVYLMCFVLFVSGALFSTARKFESIYQYGRSGIDIALALKDKTTVNPEKVLILTYEGETVKGYSVFFQDQRWAYYGGAASRFVYNYRYPEEKMNLSFKNEFEKDSIIKADGSKYNCIWIIYRDSVDVINNY